MKTHEINKLPWPENFLRSVFRDDTYDSWKENIPPDLDASIKYVLEETLTEQETYVLLAFFKERVPMRDVGIPLGIKGERCRQIEEKAIRKIRHPSRKKYLQYGLAEVERRKNEPPVVIPVIEQPIEELNLSPRVFTRLKSLNVHSIEKLTQLSSAQLMKVPNLGVKSIDEIERQLAFLGLSLAPENQ